MYFTCEKHLNCLIVSTEYHCPVCEEIAELKTDIEQTSADLHCAASEAAEFKQENDQLRYKIEKILNDNEAYQKSKEAWEKQSYEAKQQVLKLAKMVQKK